jgi:hypothetical protein
MKRLVLVLILMALLCGCDKDNPAGTSPEPTMNNYFPLAVGNWWKFSGIEVNDQGNPIAGTNFQSIMRVVGDTLANGLTYFVVRDSSYSSGSWQLDETSYMRISGDTLKFLMNMFDDPDFLEVNMAILPRTVGTTWTAAVLDTTMIGQGGESVNFKLTWMGQVAGFGPLTVPFGTHGSVYQIHQSMVFDITAQGTTMTYNRIADQWVGLDVGPMRIVQLPSTGPGDPEAGTKEELVDYDLASP